MLPKCRSAAESALFQQAFAVRVPLLGPIAKADGEVLFEANFPMRPEVVSAYWQRVGEDGP